MQLLMHKHHLDFMSSEIYFSFIRKAVFLKTENSKKFHVWKSREL